MQHTIIFIHKQNKRQFILSTRTKPHIIKLLIKKAFHLQGEIRYLRHIGGGPTLEIHQVFNFPNQNQFEIVTEDQSDEREKSQYSCSQKNMSKLSGRKHPPSQRQLIDSKFYVDDFQLFMSQVDQSKANRYFGIVFFTNKRKALFLGKKILRQLIFQFDQIQFFYALHPIKMHNTSALLGQVLVFSLFKGKKMIHQREFPEQITAAQQIVSYLKNLMKVGQLRFNKNSQTLKQKKRSKNLISVSQQRSFDQINDVLPKKKQYEQKNLTTQFFKIKQVSPQKDQQIAPIRFQSPIRSPTPNQISFQTQFYQPEWFRQGTTLDRLERSFLSAFIKQNNITLINFCQGLQLKKVQKQALNKKLLKVFLDQMIEQKLSSFDIQQKQTIFQNQQNRKHYVFSNLLKLYKFGNIDDFMQSIRKNMIEYFPKLQFSLPQRKKSSYLQVARQIQRKKKTFSIRLMQNSDQGEDQLSPEREHISLIGKHSLLNMKNQEIAKQFHLKPVYRKPSAQNYKIAFSKQLTQPDIAHIKQLINNGDACLIQNFIPNQRSKKRFDSISSQTIKYLYIIYALLQKIHDFHFPALCQPTLTYKSFKLLQKQASQIINLYEFVVFYLRTIFQSMNVQKQRHINKKQLKAFFYLYIWSDLNVLSAFQLYLEDRDLEEIMDTLYTIDYTYYLQGKYGIDMNEVENFTIAIESQLIMLFLLADKITSIEERLAVEKFIRAGDMTLYKIYHDFNLVGEDFTQKALEMCKQKRKQLEQHTKSQNTQQLLRAQRNKQRCDFIQQIKPVHFKAFTKVHIVQQCIDLNEPRIHQIFNIYDKTNELVKWIESFNEYIQNLDFYHMNAILNKFTSEAGYDFQKLKTAKPELLKGVYESYMMTTDREDAVDSIQHILKKLQKDEKASPISKGRSPTSQSP